MTDEEFCKKVSDIVKLPPMKLEERQKLLAELLTTSAKLATSANESAAHMRQLRGW